jgi:beta-fructofuranosidase
MYWGHAVSEDLVKWSYEPIALAPDTEFDKDGCFSGTSFEKNGMLYLIYTGHVYIGEDRSKDYTQTQGIAYSKDGISFKKYENNPVLNADKIPQRASKKDFRDPKIFEENGTYYMILGSNDDNKMGQGLFYKSKDLIDWEFVNILAKSDGNMGTGWECPDIFKLDNKDVFIISPQYMKPQGNDYHNTHSTIYMIGNLKLAEGIFEYKDYSPIDYGFDFYAAQTTIDNKGRRIITAWMDMWESEFPTQLRGDNWSGAMTLPREIVLKGDKLYFKPVDEIKGYRRNETVIENLRIHGEKKLDITGDSYELQAVFRAEGQAEFGLKLRTDEDCETILSYSTKDKRFRFNRDKSGIGPKGERRTEVELINDELKLRIFVDKSSVEVFVNEGEKVMTGRIYPGRDAVNIKAFSKGSSSIVSLKKWDID